MALTYTPEVVQKINCPDFTLLGLDGKNYSLANFQNGHSLVVMFICNHCPYVKAIEGRLIQLAHDLKKINVNVVAICSNDSESYPDDSFENLKKNWLEKKMPFTYLHDATQEVAQRFGAVCTPDFFVYNPAGLLSYRGRLDDSWKDATQVTRRELFESVLALEAGKEVPYNQPSMGCSIKWVK